MRVEVGLDAFRAFIAVRKAADGGGFADAFNAIGYIGYDNTAKMYQTAWMDNGSTGMVWYTGNFDASGKAATMKATVPHPLTTRPSPVELRLSIAPNGDHVTELWGHGHGAKLSKLMKLTCTKSKP